MLRTYHLHTRVESTIKFDDFCSIRRGYQVYREVCSACHSLDRIAWRNLIDVSHSEDEVKAMAEEFEYQDGPDDNGEMFMRPGKVKRNQKLRVTCRVLIYI